MNSLIMGELVMRSCCIVANKFLQEPALKMLWEFGKKLTIMGEIVSAA